MIVICDFDNTITLTDVTHLLLDHFTEKEWRDLLTPYRAGEITHFDIMEKSYAYLKTPVEELLDYARQHVKIRPNFDALIDLCQEKGWHMAVVSGGIDFYIGAFLDEGIPFHSYMGHHDEYWRIRMPEWPEVDLKAGQDFKVRVVEELKLKYPGEQVAFVGDGRNDWEAGSRADLLFTVTNSLLSKICDQQGKAHINFTDFAEVITALHKLEQAQNLSTITEAQRHGE